MDTPCQHQRRGREARHRAPFTAAAMLLLAAGGPGVAPPAQADVFEIGEHGALIVRAGSGAVQWQGETDMLSDDPALADIPLPEEALTRPAGSRAPASYAATVERLALRYDLSPALIDALVWQESRWKDGRVSPAGALGLAQLMPGTARQLGVDPRDPAQNLDGGARYLRAQLDLFDGDLEKALAAYNAGPARVQRAGGIPPIAETRAYVAAIVDRLSTLQP